MRRFVVILLLCLLAGSLYAQKVGYGDAVRSDYAAFRARTHNEYKSFVSAQNAEFADFMRKSWAEYKSFMALKKPKSLDPPAPVVKEDDATTQEQEMVYLAEESLTEPVEEPTPTEPYREMVAINELPEFGFTYHNTPCSVRLAENMRFKLPDASENSVADAWLKLSEEDYNQTIGGCLRLKKDMALCDWGYIKLLEALTSAFLGENTNESVLMQMYILTQSGYKVRIARAGQKLVMLMPCESNIYGYPFVKIDNLNYYALGDTTNSGSYFLFDREFPKEQIFSIQMDVLPKFNNKPTKPRTLTSSRFPAMSVTVTENENLMDFYNEYPSCGKWAYYAKASLTQETKRTVYPVLRSQIKGVSPKFAANMLINFVQTAFEYKTDQEQFGYERPLFGDETLFYPYSDCEDRSILYSILVKDLLGFDVVLLEFPGHLATAVRFPNGEAYGYYITIDGEKYTICDPTYINADVGDCMPQYQKSELKVIRI